MKAEAQKVIEAIEFVEVSKWHGSQTRRMMRNERFSILAALQSGEGIEAAVKEAKKVAAMWGVVL